MKKTLKYILITLVILFFLGFIIVLDSYINIDVSHYEIKSDKITNKYNNYKIMLLTDLHNRNITEKIVKIAIEEKPDIIVMSGDMINEKEEDGYTNFFNLCNELKDYTKYYVFGNHEENMTNEKQNSYIKELEEKTNVILLNNNKLELDENFNIYGFTPEVKYYMASTKEKINENYIEERIGKIDNTKFINFLLEGGNSHLLTDHKIIDIMNTSTKFLFNIDIKNPSSILDKGILMYRNNDKVLEI